MIPIDQTNEKTLAKYQLSFADVRNGRERASYEAVLRHDRAGRFADAQSVADELRRNRDDEDRTQRQAERAIERSRKAHQMLKRREPPPADSLDLSDVETEDEYRWVAAGGDLAVFRALESGDELEADRALAAMETGEPFELARPSETSGTDRCHACGSVTLPGAVFCDCGDFVSAEMQAEADRWQ